MSIDSINMHNGKITKSITRKSYVNGRTLINSGKSLKSIILNTLPNIKKYMSQNTYVNIIGIAAM